MNSLTMPAPSGYIPYHKLIAQRYGPKFSKELFISEPPLGSCSRYRYNSIIEKEPATMVWIRSLQDDSIFLDIGCNIGIYSLASYIVGAKSIYSIDPLPQNICQLSTVIAYNSIQNIFPICGLVSDRTTVQSVRPDPTSLAKFPNSNQSSGSCCLVSPVAHSRDLSPSIGTEFFRSLSCLGFTDIKVDVDGAELDVIKAIGPLLASKSLRSLAIETSLSTHPRVVSLLHAYNLRESPSFSSISKSHSRLSKGRDGMFLFHR